MATQSASGNRDSGSTLESGLSKLNKLTDEYKSALSDIKTRLGELESVKEKKGCSTIQQFKRPDGAAKWYATGISANLSEISEAKENITSLLNEIENFQSKYKALKGTSKTLETLADKLEEYQKEITKALSDDRIKSAAVSSMVAKFASNKYDAKNGDYIPKEKVSTASDSWEGDLKFVRQDNGTYLVIKVGKDGSEVPMGYTTRGGKNKYYKEAKKKVLNDLKDKTKSSKEKTTSSKEKTTSSKEENIASNSNSKSDSNSGDYVGASDINKSIKRPFADKAWNGSDGELTSDEKMQVSRKVAADLKKKPYTKADLKGCNYSYETTIKDDKKFVRVKVSKYVVNTDAINKAPELKTLMTKEYDL